MVEEKGAARGDGEGVCECDGSRRMVRGKQKGYKKIERNKAQRASTAARKQR
jgi:hypothetical protein